MVKNKYIESKGVAAGILIVLGLILFVGTATYDFVWDDIPLYLNETNYPSQDRFRNIDKFCIPGEMPMYAPVTYTVWAVIASMSSSDNSNKFGLSPFLFHLVNVFVHIANAVLVFLILLYLFKNNYAAFFAAAVFMIHPIQVESVAWVSELRGLLAALFGFSAVLLFLRREKAKENEKTFDLRFVFTVLLLILSFLSKPTGIVFPFILLTIDYFYVKPSRKKLIIDLLIFGTITLLFFLLSVTAESPAADIVNVSAVNRLLLPLHSFVFYLQKTIFPAGLTAVYGLTPQYLIESNQIYIFAGIFVVLALALHFFRDKLAEFRGGLIIAFISILPTSGIIAYYYQTFSNVADRYFYIGFFGIAILLALIFIRLKSKYKTMAVIVLLAVLFFLSSEQLGSWANDFKHWDSVIHNSKRDIPQAYMGRGEEYIALDKYDKAISDFSKAIEIDPSEPLYYYNRANAFFDIKQYDAALKDYSKALELNNKLLDAYVNRGMLYSETGHQNNAIYDFQKALELNPRQADVCNLIGVSYAIEQKYDSAETYFRKALSINPNDRDALENLKLLEETKQKEIK